MFFFSSTSFSSTSHFNETLGNFTSKHHFISIERAACAKNPLLVIQTNTGHSDTPFTTAAITHRGNTKQNPKKNKKTPTHFYLKAIINEKKKQIEKHKACNLFTRKY